MEILPVVVLDVETQCLSDEVGGWSHKADMGVSVAVTYHEDSGEYKTWFENDVPALVQTLEQANLVVGYNLLNFDYEVLWGALRQSPLMPITVAALFREGHKAWKDQIHTCDLLAYVHRALGHRLSLDQVAAGTLKESKSGDGRQAVQLYKEGRMDELVAYCKDDVKLTYDIWKFGVEKGTFWYIGRNGKAGYGHAQWQADYQAMCKFRKR